MIWTPQPTQLEFLRRQEDMVAFGGSRGGGKTDAILAYQIMRRTIYPGSRGLIVRRQLTDFSKPGGAIARSHEMLGPDPWWGWNGQTRQWTNGDGSYFTFEHCKDEKDKANFQGTQTDDLSFEELTQFTEGQFRAIIACRRTVRTDLTARVTATANPGGPGHGFVKALFVTPDPKGLRTLVDEPTGLTMAFVPSRVYDNEILMRADPTYVRYLQSLPEALRRAWLDGSWDQFEGQVFTEFSVDRHVIQPLAGGVPPSWRRIVAVDYGYAPRATGQSLAVVWLAQNPLTKEAVVYRELYTSQLRDEDQAREIVRLSKEDGRIDRAIGGHDMWAKRGDSGVAAEEIYRRNGVALTVASTERIAGKMRVHDFLSDNPVTGRPYLRIYRSCTNLIRTLPDLVYDPVHVEDVDTEGIDDPYDALRYGLMALARPPVIRKESEVVVGSASPGPDDDPDDPRFPSRQIKRLRDGA